MSPSAIVAVAKASLALAGTALIGWQVWARRSARPGAGVRFRDAALAATALLALGGWWNFGLLHSSGYVHWHEFFNHYLGAKYQREVSYTRLYHCVVVAEAGAGVSDAASGWVRNLETNVIEERRRALDDPSSCTRHFSAARWAAFQQDVRYFKSRVGSRAWRRFQVDHGYNATPVWTMVGGTLANLGAASDSLVLTLAMLDPLLLGLTWVVAWRVFGWKPASVAAIWWGTNYAARFYWTGGAFLRTDWLFLLVLSAALAHRRRMAPAGAALAGSALLRLFPGLLAGGVVVWEAARMRRARTWRPSRDFIAFAAGAVAAAAVLVVASSLVNTERWLDRDGWHALLQNTRKHVAGTGTNRMGLRTLVSFDPGTRLSEVEDLWLDGPVDAWYEARRRTFEARAPVFWLLVAGYAALLARAVSGRPLWEALVLSIGLLPILGEPTSYYYAFLLLYGLMFAESPGTGFWLCLAAFLTWLPPAVFPMADETFAAISVVVVAFVVGATALAAVPGRALTEDARSRT